MVRDVAAQFHHPAINPRIGESVMSATIPFFIAIVLTAQALPPDKAAPLPKYPIAEKIVAELQRGIVPHAPVRGGRAATSSKLAHNRVWTLKSLKATFGQPSEINDTRTLWKWQRADGTAVAEFTSKGYGGSTEPELLRLQIYASYFRPAKATK